MTKEDQKLKTKTEPKKCWHDYKHAIQIGNVDFVCPLCKRLLDPMEWFFMNSFKFIDCGNADEEIKKRPKKSDNRRKKINC